MNRIAQRHHKIALALIAWTVGSSVSLAQGGPYTVSVFPSMAPNAFGSPSFTPWESNTISALENGLSTAGNPALPSYYQQISNGANIPIWIASEFNSWNNIANPGTAFGPAFAGEFGNRLYFNVHINGNGQQFSISQLSLQTTSTDGGNFLGFSVPTGSYNYSTGFVGLNYGGDGLPGGGDDTYITSGPNTQLVNELFARGSGNGPQVLNADPGATDQDKINNALAGLPQSFIYSGTYTLDTGNAQFSGNAFVVVGVPEPSTVILAGLGGIGLGAVCIRSRRRRKFRTRKSQTASIAS